MYTRRSNETETALRLVRGSDNGRIDVNEAALAFAYHFRRASAKHRPPMMSCGGGSGRSDPLALEPSKNYILPLTPIPATSCTLTRTAVGIRLT